MTSQSSPEIEGLLTEVNRAAHSAGTNAWVRDVLKRAHRALRASQPATPTGGEACPKCGGKFPCACVSYSSAGSASLLRRARQFVADAGSDEDDMEVNLARIELLEEIDAALSVGAAQPSAVTAESVEAVARAICEAEKMNPDDALGGWIHWMDAAAAAIEAMPSVAQGWQVTDELVDRALTENVDLIQGYTYGDHHSIRDFRRDPTGPEIWRCPRSEGSPNHGIFQKRLAHEKLKAQLAAALSSTHQPCANFPGCHCTDSCIDGWSLPSPQGDGFKPREGCLSDVGCNFPNCRCPVTRPQRGSL